MARVKLEAGAEFDFLNQGELDQSLKKANEEAVAHLRAVKWMRLPETLIGTASGNSISLSEQTGHTLGPRVGYDWCLRRLVVTGLTAGATPDTINLYRGTPSGQIIWQFNGNNFGYTFGKCELTMLGGETIALASTGTFSSAAQIILSGELLEVPAELMGKMAA
jgi:hypothetical protein